MNNRLDITITNSRATDAAQSFIANITNLVKGGYTFSNNILGGYSKAEFNIGCSIAQAWQIMTDYLGKRILISSPMSPYTDMSVWEGIVYSVTIDDGRTSVNRSLETVYNNVKIAYYGTGTAPTEENDLTSRGLYGRRDLAITTSAPDTAWDNLRKTMLAQHKYPRSVQMSSNRGGNAAYPETIVRITGAGYWEQWGRRLYRSLSKVTQNPVAPFEEYTSNWLIQSEYMSAPYINAYQSTDYSHLDQQPAPQLKLGRYTPTYTTLQTLIGKLCGLGDGTFARWQFGFWENGNPYFQAEPSTPTYRMSRFDKGERIYDYLTGVEVPPFLVRAGKMVEVSDLMPDSLTYNSYLGDPRRMVIAEATYTSPGGLVMTPQIQNPGQVRLDRLAIN